MNYLDLKIETPSIINLEIDAPESVPMGLDMTVHVDGVPYTGQTVVVPSNTRQVLETEGTLLMQNITIEPIPNNYGLISWNGVILTVS